MTGSTAAIRWRAPKKFASNSRRVSESVFSSKGLTTASAALLTRISMRLQRR